MAAVVLLVVSIVVVLAGSTALVWRFRDPGRRRDAELELNASPGWSLVGLVLTALFAVGAIVVGVVLVTGRDATMGSVFLVCAVLPLVQIGLTTLVFRQRLTRSECPEDPEA